MDVRGFERCCCDPDPACCSRVVFVYYPSLLRVCWYDTVLPFPRTILHTHSTTSHLLRSSAGISLTFNPISSKLGRMGNFSFSSFLSWSSCSEYRLCWRHWIINPMVCIDKKMYIEDFSLGIDLG